MKEETSNLTVLCFFIIRTRYRQIPKKLKSATASHFENTSKPNVNALMKFVLEEVDKFQNLLTLVTRTEIFRCNAEDTKNYTRYLRSQLQRQSLRSWLSTKVYYVPLYFGIYFTIYIGYLILKSISAHKIQIPSTKVSSVLHFARYFQSSLNLRNILIFD